MIDIAFVMGIIGAAVAMIIGIIVYSEVSGAANEGYSVTTVNVDSSNQFEDMVKDSVAYGFNQFANREVANIVDTTATWTIYNVTISMGKNNNPQGTIDVRIYTDAQIGQTFDPGTLQGTSTNSVNTVTEITAAQQEFTFTFDPPVVVSDPNTAIAIHLNRITDSGTDFTQILYSNPQIELVKDSIRRNVFTSDWTEEAQFGTQRNIWMEVDSTITTSTTTPPAPEGLARADSIAFTVLTIIPISMFFGLFAIFGGFNNRGIS